MSKAASTALGKGGVTFDGHPVRFHLFRGRICVVSAEVGAALGYADNGKSLVDVIRKQWGEELIEGEDFDVLTGTNLRDFKRAVALTESSSVSANARSLMVLYEAGVDGVCLKTDKPDGVRLRRFLRRDVLPKIRRGEAVLPGPEPPPVFAPAASPAALSMTEERVGALVDGRVRALLGESAVDREQLLALARTAAEQAAFGVLRRSALDAEMRSFAEVAAREAVRLALADPAFQAGIARLADDAARRGVALARSEMDDMVHYEYRLDMIRSSLTGEVHALVRREYLLHDLRKGLSGFGLKAYEAAKEAGLFRTTHDFPREHVFVVLASYCDEGGRALIGQRYLHEVLRYGDESIRKHVKGLRETGWLRVEFQPDYALVLQIPEKEQSR